MTRILALPRQASVVWMAFVTSRSLPLAMLAGVAAKRCFTSLVPSMMMSRSTGSWVMRQGWMAAKPLRPSKRGSSKEVVLPLRPSSRTR